VYFSIKLIFLYFTIYYEITRTIELSDKAAIVMTMKTQDDQLLELMAGRMEALGNPIRLGIFRALIKAGNDGANVGTIQNAIDIPASTLTHHIQKLVKAGLISQQRHSRELICRAEFEVMDGTIDYLKDECCQGLGLLQRKVDQL